jgi:hypothetical protein
VKLHFLSPLYGRTGPVASVYLDTSRDVDDPDRAIELRWRRLRESLLDQGADQATVGAVQHVVGGDRAIAGRHGQAVFAARGRLMLVEDLPDPPGRDIARYDALPDALPLALQHAPGLRYAALALQRVPAPGTGSADEDELEVDHQIGSWPMSRITPPAARRTVPVAGWPKEAEHLLADLAGHDAPERPELVVVAGDPWAVDVLLRLAPDPLRQRVLRLKDHQRAHPEPGRALLESELAWLLADRLPERDRQQLDAFQAQRDRDPERSEGIAAVVDALRGGQAQAVLLHRPVPPLPRVRVAMAPGHLALTAAELQALGLTSHWDEDAGAALVRAAVSTQADLIPVPAADLPLADGLGVLLRTA